MNQKRPGAGKLLTVLLLVTSTALAGCGGGGGGSGGGGGGGSPSPSSPTPSTPSPSPAPAPAPTSPFQVSNPFAQSGATSVEQVRVDDLRIFGDSYSVPNFGGATTTWGTVLERQGTAADLENYAIGGARAASGSSIAFDRQIDTWAGTGSSIGAGDLTAVYFGYNDLSQDLAAGRAGYRAGIDRLVAAGAARSDRKLFVTLLTDWTRGPGITSDFRGRVNDWNGFVSGIANGNDNIIAVDLFTVFEKIYDDPGRFGFNNVSTVDAGRSDSDALFFDPAHFGDRGQDIIARVYRHYLTRAWDWANTIDSGSSTARQLGQDIDNGLLVLGLDDSTADRPLGLSTFAFGNAGSDAPRAVAFGERVDGRLGMTTGAAAAASDPTRLGFSEAYRQTSEAGGVALDVNLGTDGSGQAHRFGLAVSRYDDASGSSDSATSLVREQSSDAVSLYWQQEAAVGFLATTQFSYLEHQFEDRSNDEILGNSGVNEHTGRSWALDQKIARPTRVGSNTFVPWASLGYQLHELDPYEAESLYTSDVGFSGAQASDVLGALGLDIRHEPIDLGGGRHLWLKAGASYLASLYRDDVEVTMSEAALPGLSQEQTIERDQIERVDVSVDAVLGLNPDLNLRAAYAFTTDRVDHDQLVRFSLDYRF